MKRHAAFFIGLVTIVVLLGWWFGEDVHILNESWWKSDYTSNEIESGILELKELKTDKNETFYLTKFSDNTIRRLDVFGVFSKSSNTVYLDTSNHYLLRLNKGIVTQKIYIDTALGEIQDVASDGRGNTYIYSVNYGTYASMIEREAIQKYDDQGNFVSTIYEVHYQGEDRPFLSGTIKNLEHNDDGLQFFRLYKDTLSHFTNTYETIEDMTIDLSENDSRIENIVGHQLGDIVFATNKSELGHIDENGQLLIERDYLDEKMVIRSLSLIEEGRYRVDIRGDYFDTTEIASLEDGQLETQIVKKDDLTDSSKMHHSAEAGFRFSGTIRTADLTVVTAFVSMLVIALYACFFAYKYLMQGRTVIAVKQLLFLIPIILIVMLVFVLQTVLNGFEEFGNEIKQGKYAQFNKIIDYQLEEASRTYGEDYLVAFLEGIIPHSEIDKEAYEAFYEVMSLDQLKLSSDVETLSLREDITGMYVVIDRVYDDKAYKILDTENKFKLFTPRSDDNAYFKKAKKGIQVNAIGTGDAYIFSMRPIYNNRHEVLGIYQIGMKYAGYRQQLDTKLVMTSIQRIILLTAVLLLAITLTTLWSLRSIGKLTKGVRAVTSGDLETQIDIRSNDEVSELADAFNSMTESIRISIEEMRTLSESYYRFVPQEIFQLLGNDDIRMIENGDSGKFDAVLMAAAIDGFYKQTVEMTPEESFDLINNHLGRLGPIIRKHGGVVDRYTDIGLVAIFADGSKSAVDAAIEISKLNETLEEDHEKLTPINMTLHRSNVLVGVVGEEKRLQSGIISDDVSFIQQLLERNQLLSSKILMTNAVYDLLPTSSFYELRDIGRVQLQGSDESHRLYDIYQGDALVAKTLKRQYEDIFKEAVKAYEKGEYYIARAGFVKILEMNFDDGAARVYFHDADKKLRQKASENTPLRI